MVTQGVNDDGDRALRAAAVQALAVRTPTLPPATHTNVYIVGQGELLVVDPASPYPEEQRALETTLERRLARGERVRSIFLTHQHVDHVSGALALKAVTGAPILAHAETARRLHARIPVDELVDGDDTLEAGGRTLKVVHTPGHAPGHLCLHDRASGTVLCGDMVASVGTILIDPEDDGDMRLYLESLERLRALGARCLLPAHGPPICNADEHLAFYIAHRLGREGKVLAALDELPRDLDTLVRVAYADTDPSIYPLAKRSLRAHLDKLVDERRARRDAHGWRRGAP